MGDFVVMIGKKGSKTAAEESCAVPRLRPFSYPTAHSTGRAFESKTQLSSALATNPAPDVHSQYGFIAKVWKCAE